MSIPPPKATITLPQSADIEISVLGGLLLEPSAWEDCRLTEACFHDDKRRRIYTAMAAVHQAGNKADLVMTQQRLEADKNLDAVGGLMALVELTAGIVSRGDALPAHSERLRDLAARRLMIAQAREMAAQAADLTQDLGESWSKGRKSLDELFGAGSPSAQCPAEYVQEWVERCERLTKSAAVSVPVPYQGLSKLCTGLFPGEVTVLAARPGVGKTAFALNLLEFAMGNGVPCGMFSLEMNKFLLLNRLASAREQIDASRFRDGQFSSEDWDRIYRYADLVSKYPLRTWDQAMLRPRDLRAQCRAWKRDMGLRFIVIDYLQLCVGDQRGGSREREIAEISRACKELAQELDLAVLLLSQLNREADKAKKPLLSQLRESGAIEQDADQILFLVPPGGAGAAYEADVVEVEGVLAKARNSPPGTFRLLYHRKHVLFADGEGY